MLQVKADNKVCNICHGGVQTEGLRPLGQVNNYPIFRCPDCRLIYVFPKPALQEIEHFYTNYHTNTAQYDLGESGEAGLFEDILQRINQIVLKGEILDIGASYGHFLDLARKRGFRTRGIEIAAGPSAYARQHLGLDVDHGTLSETCFESNRFAAISMLNVLEHLPDPHADLVECWRITRPGGVIVVVVPNLLLAYPLFRITRWFGWDARVPTSAFDVPAHLTLFSPVSLGRMLQGSGWTDIQIQNAPVIRNKSWIRTSLKNAVYVLGLGLDRLTAHKVLYGYSLVASARKPGIH